MPKPVANAGSMLTPALSGTAMLIFVQLASRLFIFGSNQMILRSLSPSILGIAAQLDLLMISILFFSRESIRAAIQRQPLQPIIASLTTGKGANKASHEQIHKAHAQSSQSIVNVSYLSIAIGAVMTMAFVAFYVHFASSEVLETAYYHMSVAVTASAALIELGSEPSFTVVQHYMMYSERAAVEISAAFSKSLITCATSTWAARGGHDLGVLPFAIGHLSYSAILFCGYFMVAINRASHGDFSLRLSRLRSSEKSTYLADRFSWLLLSLSANIFFQSVVKHLLTQGDSMILAAMTSLQDQGIYSLASNYGGLLARVLFQPIEESSRTIFSSLLGTKEGQGRDANIRAAKTHLLYILRDYMVISVLIIPLGPSLAPKIFHFVGGRRWTAPEVNGLLSLYCYYIPFLAFNGIIEAFVSSIASPAELRKQTAWMTLFSGLFALAAYLFLSIGGLGARGLVYANIVNMSVRIIWSLSFSRQYLRQNESDLAITELALRPETYAASAIMAVLLSEVASNLDSNANLILFVGGGFYILLVLYFEREHVITHYNKIYKFIGAKRIRTKIE
ncbi:Rft protein-domain-containing protein [Aspergillus karnatakaensis]|uniref:putative nuclear division Rft1 protein n=1 Tax=Aspergillus karnatakaensis TaxID=1810916 RepID=UPI003CCC98E8